MTTNDEEAARRAAQSVEVKEAYPHVDDPIRAINFAIDCCGVDAICFLDTWRDGDWYSLRREWSDYLERCKS